MKKIFVTAILAPVILLQIISCSKDEVIDKPQPGSTIKARIFYSGVATNSLGAGICYWKNGEFFPVFESAHNGRLSDIFIVPCGGSTSFHFVILKFIL